VKKRVIIIGLDGATLDLIEPWVKKGLLPYFATLLEQGAVQHCFWKYMDPTHPQHNPKEAALWGDTILNAYRKIDEAIGEIKKRLGTNDLLLIMSDYGFGQKHPASNQLNAWLASKGYLNYHTKNCRRSFAQE